MFLGNSEDGAVPYVLPDEAFGRLSHGNAISVHTAAADHQAAFATLAGGVDHIPTIAGGAGTEMVRPRRVLLLPPSQAAALVTTANSRLSLTEFWTQVIQPLEAADPVGNKPAVDWWKAATTLNGPDHHMSLTCPQAPVTDLTFWAWARRAVLSLEPSPFG